ncbi:MAG: hypothetical protein ACE5J1_05110, partial [Nitrospiria bacterium]
EAKEIYQKISEDFSRSPWGAEAEARWTLLTPPAETDLPSPEEEAPEANSTSPDGAPEANSTTPEEAPEELKEEESRDSGPAAEIEPAE